MRIVVHIDGKDREYELSEDTVKALEAIAARNGLGFVEALQQAVANENFIEDKQANGAKLLIDQGDGIRELRREPLTREPTRELA